MKLAIVSASPSNVDLLRRLLTVAPEHPILWTASKAPEAFDHFHRLPADLVLLDLTLPGLETIETTEWLVAQGTCTVLIVTNDVDRSRARVFEAMRHGALDAAELPAPDAADLGVTGAPLLAKIAMINRLGGAIGKPNATAETKPPTTPAKKPLMVAIGASAGGPAALATLLKELPADIPASIVIVQHVDERFAAGMAEWLGAQTRLSVCLAREGDLPLPNTVMLAGSSDHLILKTPNRLGYIAEPREYVYRPSIDEFFRSVASLWQGDVIGVILTGMGADGANGLGLLRARGHHTIAQDQASSAVYGMPKAAAAANAAVDILPLRQIASRLLTLACRGRCSARKP